MTDVSASCPADETQDESELLVANVFYLFGMMWFRACCPISRDLVELLG